jgi:hypothetical protein
MVFSLACKKTVDSEKKAWEYNLKKMTELSYEYPTFKNVIMDQQKAAEALMNDSASISDEKAKIEKMASANSMLRSTFLRNLEKITDLKDSISRKAVQVRECPCHMIRGAVRTRQCIPGKERSVTLI